MINASVGEGSAERSSCVDGSTGTEVRKTSGANLNANFTHILRKFAIQAFVKIYRV